MVEFRGVDGELTTVLNSTTMMIQVIIKECTWEDVVPDAEN